MGAYGHFDVSYSSTSPEPQAIIIQTDDHEAAEPFLGPDAVDNTLASMVDTIARMTHTHERGRDDDDDNDNDYDDNDESYGGHGAPGARDAIATPSMTHAPPREPLRPVSNDPDAQGVVAKPSMMHASPREPLRPVPDNPKASRPQRSASLHLTHATLREPSWPARKPESLTATA